MVERHYLAVLAVHRVLPNCTALFNGVSLYIFYNPLLVLKICFCWYPKLKVGANILIELWKSSKTLLLLNSGCGKFPQTNKTPKWSSQNAAAYSFKLWTRSFAWFYAVGVVSEEGFWWSKCFTSEKSHEPFPSFSCLLILAYNKNSKKNSKVLKSRLEAALF